MQASNEKKGIINYKKYKYDFNSRLLFYEDGKLRFTEKENEIFACLINYSNNPISKQKLLKDIWEHLKEWSDWKLKDWIKAAIVALVVIVIIGAI